ncbi:hypothetical protein B0H10DRAFT_358400 [Mycena sp. CBHHK59/15]|nr:hypothetical protein B0H10DRAFT_358400 [Mycena sp. CBHHK59/15]
MSNLAVRFSASVDDKLTSQLRTNPQALSVGLSIGAAYAPVILAFMYLFAPLAYPITPAMRASWKLVQARNQKPGTTTGRVYSDPPLSATSSILVSSRYALMCGASRAGLVQYPADQDLLHLVLP